MIPLEIKYKKAIILNRLLGNVV
ncbi:Protein of unknown function [Bacillus mycoides]|nr:Protein of unknown function [Bacillus mycoides]